MLVGNGRVGKSTRSNQLLLHEIRPNDPFQAENGAQPVTMKFQYAGPFKFGQLAQLHNVDLKVESDPDIFLIDCEGLHSLGKTTPVLKQATFALSQMVSMTILVMKEQVNHDNIDSVRSLFVLSHAFSRDLPGFAVGTTIMMREVGVRYPRGKKLTLNEKNTLRQKADIDERTKILGTLNRHNVAFSEDNFLVLAQPEFDEPDLYWKSIEDLILFMGSIAGKRGTISGESLLDLFNEAQPSIMQITDFAKPSIPFDIIIQNITSRYLKEASSTAIEDGKTEIQAGISQLKSAKLRTGLDVQFVGNLIVRCLRVFEEKAEQLFPHLLEYSPEQSENHRILIKNTIEQFSNQLFVQQCITVLVPELAIEIFEEFRRILKKR
jgi:hypothetical protein